MNRGSQILIGIFLMIFATIFGLWAIFNDGRAPINQHVKNASELIGSIALCCAFMGMSCLVRWGRPWTVQISMWLICLGLVAFVVAGGIQDRRDFLSVLIFGPIVYHLGKFAISGKWSANAPVHDVVGREKVRYVDPSTYSSPGSAYLFVLCCGPIRGIGFALDKGGSVILGAILGSVLGVFVVGVLYLGERGKPVAPAKPSVESTPEAPASITMIHPTPSQERRETHGDDR